MVNIKMKTKVEDINRNIYDIKNEDNYDFKMEKGINEEKKFQNKKTNRNGC